MIRTRILSPITPTQTAFSQSELSLDQYYDTLSDVQDTLGDVIEGQTKESEEMTVQIEKLGKMLLSVDKKLEEKPDDTELLGLKEQMRLLTQLRTLEKAKIAENAEIQDLINQKAEDAETKQTAEPPQDGSDANDSQTPKRLDSEHSSKDTSAEPESGPAPQHLSRLHSASFSSGIWDAHDPPACERGFAWLIFKPVLATLDPNDEQAVQLKELKERTVFLEKQLRIYAERVRWMEESKKQGERELMTLKEEISEANRRDRESTGIIGKLIELVRTEQDLCGKGHLACCASDYMQLPPNPVRVVLPKPLSSSPFYNIGSDPFVNSTKMQDPIHNDAMASCPSDHDNSPPSFLLTKAEDVNTLDDLIPLFHSLVRDSEEGHKFNKPASKQLRALLRRIDPICRMYSAYDEYDFKTVGSTVSSFNPFIESIVSLLTCSNKDLVQSTISCLSECCVEIDISILFKFMDSGLLSLLPKEFYLPDVDLLTKPRKFLIDLVNWFLYCFHPDNILKIRFECEISLKTFQNIFIDKFFRPIEPFLDFICRNRRRIEKWTNPDGFANLIGALVVHSPMLHQMTKIVLSSSVPCVFSDCLAFFESNEMIKLLIRSVMNGFKAWREEDPVVLQRGLQMVTKLNDEGFSDEIELHIRCRGYGVNSSRFVLVGARLIDLLGGNLI
ncbi:hypothetical protein BLNAU_11413 [Blattamonas nauphoetae]|uniref:Uncharacterized protein n=1 Tax=Blattamonas nauphoetae TaxID=2049346 RepID=A0ABQ9XMR6_9EUKA|nr:hypothetical protein BLNAU_17288 [Blattamonas nauphoetae]KAK2953692.1 hypothetical protein BLNAU_11413 [Blattamonas nauphoetae]